jgi:hypothetical protein
MGRPSAIPIAPGLRFGRLTVVEQTGLTSNGGFRWKCRCDCGNISYPGATDLRQGLTQSCGCLRKDTTRERTTKDMTGLRFGRLTVISRDGLAPRGPARWKCRCDCGNVTQSGGHDLRRGKIRSCGCWHKEINHERFTRDIAGQKFGRLTALHQTGERRDGRIMWRLRCECGREIDCSSHGLLGARTRSCGCLQREYAAQLKYRHGGCKSLLYRCWRNIKKRCLNPKNQAFKNYGGRGISMAPEWAGDFAAFKEYVDRNLGPKPKGDYSIDRIKNHEGYFPGNLRWATRTEQNHNTRRNPIEKVVTAMLVECRNKT